MDSAVAVEEAVVSEAEADLADLVEAAPEVGEQAAAGSARMR